MKLPTVILLLGLCARDAAWLPVLDPQPVEVEGDDEGED